MTSTTTSGSPRPARFQRWGGLRRAATMSGLVVVAAAALSGCFKMDMQLELQSDDTVDGSIVLAVAKDQAELLGGADAIRESLQGEGEGIFSGAPEQGTYDQRDYEDDDWVGTEGVFSDIPIDEFGSGDGGELSITRDGDEFVVEGTMDLSTVDQEQASQAVMDTAELNLTITFPGEVSESNGEVDGNSVSWVPTPGEVLEINARGAADSGMNWMLIGAIVALIALVVIGVVLLIMVRGRSTAADGPTEAEGLPMGEGVAGDAPGVPAAPEGISSEPPNAAPMTPPTAPPGPPPTAPPAPPAPPSGTPTDEPPAP